ncbi:LysR family transcriptional regulator [Melittangium boletus]|uniref:LysR family transcriptional regulator n=1 Tax=Melittangium boletus DSM 14713 TaxID=1294270 RepID=A0A250IQL5_9BACT|nr:LysR family transcriptional regulator [Melittangium boletus]ATB34045.1 LysR family transcriptional regulator [Melittangium boletus DSM 14713]
MEIWPYLQAFIQSVRSGSFSAAAREAGTTPSAFSKKVAKLEAHLNLRLVVRGVHGLELTPEGLEFFHRVRQAFDDIEDACAQATRATVPRGRVRVSAPRDLGRLWLMPRIASFAQAWPQVELEVSLSDQFVDLIAERVDVAVRVGTFEDGRLARRRIGRLRRCFCASPAYLRARGTPRTIEELAGHVHLAYLRGGLRVPWQLPGGGQLEPRGPFAADSNDALRQLLLDGLGIASVPELSVAEDVKRGRLEVFLEDMSEEGLPISLAFVRGRPLAPRIRAVVDFFAEAARTSLPQ